MGARRRMFADGCGRHERHHRYRPHREDPTATQYRVQQQRRHTGIQTHFGRQTREQGVGQTLRDQHHGDDDRRNKVAGKGLSVVLTTPIQNRY